MAVSLASVLGVVWLASGAQLGLGPAGDVLAILALLALRAIPAAALAILVARRLSRPALGGWGAVMAVAVAGGLTLSNLVPTAWSRAYLFGLLLLLAWPGAALGAMLLRDGAVRASRREAGHGVAALCGVVAAALWLAWPGWEEGGDVAFFPSPVAASAPWDPTRPGPWEVEELTYGSGTAQRRQEYAAGGDLLSRTADLDGHLGGFVGWRAWLHEGYWGFAPDRAPLNGRLWIPAGSDSRPLVVVVHGQHSTAVASETGYAYLARLLASRGFVVMAIDQNYLNGPWIGARGREMAVRAALLAEHLRLAGEWNDAPGSPLHRRLDLQRVAVVGHSRGAEAAALLARYPAAFGADVEIHALVALAPTDRSVREPPGTPGGVNYLVLQGGQDADVAAFQGARLYHTMAVGPGSAHFKAAVYLPGANHVRFNTAWGDEDLRGPLAWMINRRPLMPGPEQRRAAALYATAFLEASLNGDDGFHPLLLDPSVAAALLPATPVVTRYQNHRTLLVDTFEEDRDPRTTTLPGGSHTATHFDGWREEPLLLRDRFATPQGSTALELRWDRDAPDDQIPVFQLRVPHRATEEAARRGAFLVMAVGSLSTEEVPDLSVELVDRDGARASLPLSAFASLQPALAEALWKSRLLQDFMVRGPEQLLQNVRLPLARFEAANPAFDADELQLVRLRFDRASAGTLLIDDIGIAW
jgi:dienelactone hydrolase